MSRTVGPERRAQSATSARRVGARERELAAVGLRLQGLPYGAIAARLGTSRGTAHALVLRSLERTAGALGESAGVLREIEVARLDELLAGLWPAAISGDVPSVGMALRVAERRARLLGLDAPTRQELTGADGGPLSFVEVATAWARDRVTA